jgi:type VI secretion system VasD/TssJ family lipoprotein
LSRYWLPISQEGISRFRKRGGASSSRAAVSVFVILLVTVLAVGCSSDTKKWRLVLTATQTLNQDDSGEGLPVVVRIYQLRGKDKFQQATFKALWKNDKELLEGDLLDRKELTVHPDSETVLDLDLDVKHGAAFFGVMALFRKPDVTSWKELVPAETSSLNPFTPKRKLVLDHYTVKMMQ